MRRKKVRLAIVLALFLAVLGALWLELYALHRGAMLEELARWREAGGQTTLAAMLPESVAVERNAALGLYRAFSRMPLPTAAQQSLLREPWRAVGLPELIAGYQPTLALVREAVDLPETAWPVVYSDGPEAVRRHLLPAQTVARLLVAEAIVRAEAGDAEGAAASIEAGLMLGEHLRADPSFHAASIHRELEAATLLAFERIFSERPLPATEIDAVLARRDYRGDVRRGLSAEGAMWLMQMDPSVGLADLGGYRYSTSEIRRGTAHYLRSLRGFMAYFDLPYHRVAEAEEIAPPPPWARLLETLTVIKADYSRSLAVCEARLTMARLAIRLREHKAASGAYPATLDAIDASATDPLTGRPLRYAAVGEGFALWSEGAASPPVAWRWER